MDKCKLVERHDPCGWMDGWMDGWIDGWVDGWMDEEYYLPQI